MRVEVHVRPGSSRTSVGGDYGGALVVRVVEPAESGRATDAAIRAVADALDVAVRRVTLLRGATSRRKLLDIQVDASESEQMQKAVDALLVQSQK